MDGTGINWNTVTAFLFGSTSSAAIIGAVATWFGNRLTSQFEAALRRTEVTYESTLRRTEAAYQVTLSTQQGVDTDLRTQRIPSYQKLWTLTQVLPRWPRPPQVTYGQLVKFSENLRTWYFTVGGWLLSEDAKDAYLAVQEAMWDSKDSPLGKYDALASIPSTEPITPKEYTAVMEKCSELRTRLTMDLESRRGGPIADELLVISQTSP